MTAPGPVLPCPPAGSAPVAHGDNFISIPTARGLHFVDGRMTDDIDALWTGTNFDEVEAATADFDFE